ncbi:MAG: T9SS type A sorting domain-containing protein, partial [Chitinophagales bacterium]|nr:T9SS type A sorting domain-containing protein [Chitinophagales bacterium]
WDKGFIISGSAYHWYDSLGIYSQDVWLVKLDSNGCLVPNCFTNIGTFEINDALEMQLFPNPAHEQTIINYNLPASQNEASIILYDLQGRILRKEKLNAARHQINFDLTPFVAGVYLVELKTPIGTITKKLLKQ